MRAISSAPAALLSEWARLFVRSLAELGVRNVVVSPGSRSTPLTWAFGECDAFDRVCVIDERSAGFFALGQAKQTGAPSALVCTSGTAAAHYLPAVIEAALSYTPLILITADRPFELQACHAAQTIDQVKLFGDFARAFFDLGMPDPAPGALRALRRIAAQAVTTSRTPTPGPVHVNFRARKPLEPIFDGDAASQELGLRVNELLNEPIPSPTPPALEPDAYQIKQLAERCRLANRGVITLGPAAASSPELGPALAALLDSAPLMVFCEATSRIRLALPREIPASRVCDAFDLVYSTHQAQSWVPDLVLQLGAPPTSGAWERLLSSSARFELHVIAEHGWPDPANRAASVTRAAPSTALRRLATELAKHTKTPQPLADSWLAGLSALNGVAWRGVETQLRAAASTVPLDEPLVVRSVVDALPRGTLVALGNSLAVREIDQVVPAGDRGLGVWSQRGANGIDGLISGASGAARCHQGPCLLLLGDISFLHDIGGLWAARGLKTPFVIVVLNNGGGRIFEQLPLMQTPGLGEAQLDLWLTPHDLDLHQAANLYGIRGSAVRTLPELRAALSAALAHGGTTLLDVKVAPQSAVSSRKATLQALEREIARSAETQ